MSPEAPPLAAREWALPAASTVARKQKLGLCVRYGCLAKRGAKKQYCCKHHHQALKRRDPISYIYSQRKQRAKARGHAWTLTLDNFRDWCHFTGYHEKTGRTAESASIDRKINAHGYHVWNIRCIPYGANAAKYTHAGGGSWAVGDDGAHHYTPASDADAAYYAAAEARAPAYEFHHEPAPF